MDALCLAVSGLFRIKQRIHFHTAAPAKDTRGLNMEIVYGKKESELKLYKWRNL
jgi:hypothetical protein